jgi:hypothetical protein
MLVIIGAGKRVLENAEYLKDLLDDVDAMDGKPQDFIQELTDAKEAVEQMAADIAAAVLAAKSELEAKSEKGEKQS